LLDAALNALMLTLALRIDGAGIVPVRVMLGAFAGALAAAGARFFAAGQNVWLWLPAAMIMMMIAQGRAAHRNPIRQALLLFCAAGLVGGLVLAFSGATGSLSSGYLLGGTAAAAVSLRAARGIKHACDAADVRMICTCCGKTAVFEAMIDSGNTLRDYLTHLPVIVIPEKTGRHALSLPDAPLRPIFAQTAGGRQQMHVVAPQEILLDANGKKRRVHAVIALSPQMSRDVPALVPALLMDRSWNSDRGGSRIWNWRGRKNPD